MLPTTMSAFSAAPCSRVRRVKLFHFARSLTVRMVVVRFPSCQSKDEDQQQELLIVYYLCFQFLVSIVSSHSELYRQHTMHTNRVKSQWDLIPAIIWNTAGIVACTTDTRGLAQVNVNIRNRWACREVNVVDSHKKRIGHCEIWEPNGSSS